MFINPFNPDGTWRSHGTWKSQENMGNFAGHNSAVPDDILEIPSSYSMYMLRGIF